MRLKIRILTFLLLAAAWLFQINITTAQAQDITSNLIAHWKLEETSGNTIADSAGSHTGSWADGENGDVAEETINGVMDGSALNFDGTNSMIYVTGDLGEPTDMTLSAWINPTGLDTNGSIVMSIGARVTLQLLPGLIQGNFYNGSSWVYTTDNTDYIGGGWILATYVIDDTNDVQTLYINGQAVATTNNTSSTTWGSGDSRIGTHVFSTTTWEFQGDMDDVRVYNRALTAPDVAALYNAAYPCTNPAAKSGTLYFNDDKKVMQYCNGTNWVAIGKEPASSTGLVGHWKLDETSGSAIADSSGSGNNGTWSDGADNDVTGETGIGQVGTALTFNGTDDGISIPTSALYDGTHGAWSLWFKTEGDWPDTGTSVDSVVLGRHNSTGSFSGLSMIISPTGALKAQAKDSGGVTCVKNPGIADATDGLWHHAVINYSRNNGENIDIYFDGAYAGSCTNSADWDFNSNIVKLGDASDAFWDRYKGEVDDVRIYSRTLSADEIADLYDAYASPESYEPLAAYYDGNSYHYYNGSGWGLSNSKQFTASFWIKPDVDPDQNSIATFANNSTNNYFKISLEPDNKLKIISRNSTYGGTVLDATSATTFTDGVWHHVLMSFDMSDPTKRHLIINGVADAMTVTTYVNYDIRLAYAYNYVGCEFADGVDCFHGEMADFWLDSGIYMDFSNSANIQKFIKNGQTVDIGADGSTPTGSQPDILLPGTSVNYHDNRGTAANTNKSLGGDVVAAASNPYSGTGELTCSNPTAYTGEILFNTDHNVMQYCNGSAWIAMAQASDGGAGTCSSPSGVTAELRYNSDLNVLQYCEGDEWIAVSYKEETPSLILDFEGDNYALDGTTYADFTSIPGAIFTRAAPATTYAEDSAGNLVAFSANEPRITDNGLLIEEAQTNLVLHSQNFSDASWAPTRITVNDNQSDPIGTTTAAELVATGVADPYFGQSIATGDPSDRTFTYSFWMKAGTQNAGETLCVKAFSYGSSSAELDESLDSLITNDWKRYAFTRTFPSGMVSTAATFRVDPYGCNPGMGGTNNVSAGSSVFIWGFQVEEADSASSYIPTSGSTVTRNKDEVSLDVSTLPLGNGYAAYTEAQVNALGSNSFPRVFQLDNGDGGNRQHLFYHVAADRFYTEVYDGGSDQVSGIPDTTGISTNELFKAAMRVNTNDYNNAFNGTASTAKTSIVYSTPTELYLGDNVSGNAKPGQLLIRELRLYSKPLTDAQLQSLTAP